MNMRSNKPVIAHYNSEFGQKSQTFIYQYLSNLKNFRLIFFAEEFKNLDLFPLEKNDLYLVPAQRPQKYTKQWLYYEVLCKCFGMNMEPEEMILRNRKVRLIHAHFGPQGFSALKMRGNLKVPIITNFYGYDVSRLVQHQEWRDRYSILFQEGDLFLVEGEFMKSRVMELGCPKNKIKIQRIAIPVDKIPFCSRLPKKNNEKAIFVFCGRFVEKKGLIYALQALREVRNRRKDFEFWIIGDGPLRPLVESFIQESQMSPYVKLWGFLNYKDYLNEMQKADIFVHPSVTAADGNSEGGAPTTILEAQAMGLPVVATFHADIPNVVVPNESALLSQERDVPGLASNIEYLLDNQDRWGAMGRKGRDFVEQNHDFKNGLVALEERYRSLI